MNIKNILFFCVTASLYAGNPEYSSLAERSKWFEQQKKEAVDTLDRLRELQREREEFAAQEPQRERQRFINFLQGQGDFFFENLRDSVDIDSSESLLNYEKTLNCKDGNVHQMSTCHLVDFFVWYNNNKDLFLNLNSGNVTTKKEAQLLLKPCWSAIAQGMKIIRRLAADGSMIFYMADEISSKMINRDVAEYISRAEKGAFFELLGKVVDHFNTLADTYNMFVDHVVLQKKLFSGFFTRRPSKSAMFKIDVFRIKKVTAFPLSRK